MCFSAFWYQQIGCMVPRTVTHRTGASAALTMQASHCSNSTDNCYTWELQPHTLAVLQCRRTNG